MDRSGSACPLREPLCARPVFRSSLLNIAMYSRGTVRTAKVSNNDMVALREDQPLSLTFSRYPSQVAVPVTQTKMRPRDGPTIVWTDEMNDIMSTEGLTRYTNMTEPTLEMVHQVVPRMNVNDANKLLADLKYVWWQASTRMYHIWRKSIDLSGSNEQLDLEYIHVITRISSLGITVMA